MMLRSIAAIVLTLIALADCRRATDPVRASLDEMIAAARQRDAGGVSDHLSADFRGDDGSGRAEALSALRRYFAAYETLDVSVRDLSIERGEKAALARFTAKLSGQPRKIGGLEGLLPSASSYRFELRFVPEDGGWKVAWAAWTQVAGER